MAKTLIKRPSALTSPARPAQVVLKVENTDKKGVLALTFPSKEVAEYETTHSDIDPRTGRLDFTSQGTDYRVREFREGDGTWLSSFHIDLPIQALEGLAMATEENETLQAYALDDSAYVLGVLYTNQQGSWSREDGDWILLGDDDDTFDDMMVLTIDPERAQEFLDLYDENHVSVTDAQTYESADSAEDVVDLDNPPADNSDQ